MKFGSLFSGIGGFDLGFERAGLKSAWQVEIDKDCKRVLSKHWPNVKRFDDVSTVKELPAVDVLCGGFPCQDLSVAGKREGLAGKRSGLWFEFLRIVRSGLPRIVCIENVPGLYSSGCGHDFATIVRGLVECGYCVGWRVFDAQYFGVAQRRRRVFIVGSLGNGSCAQILFEFESVSGNPPTRGEARAGVAEVSVRRAQTSSNGWGVRTDGSTGTLDGTGGDAVIAATLDQRGRGPTDAVMMNLQISGAVSSKWAKGTGGPAGDEAYNLVTHALRSEGADASEDGTGRGTPLVVDRLEHHRFHCLTCGCWFGVNDYEERIVTCPSCGETHIDKITDVLDNDPDIAATLNSGGNNGGFRSEPGEHLVATAYRTAGNCGPFEQGDKTAALNTATDPNQNIIAFSSKDHGADAGEISPTLRSQNFKDSHMNGGGQVAVAFESRVARNGRGAPSDIVPPLKAESGQTGKGDSAPLTAGNFGVRRLTPRECERLQSFPDDFTRWDSEGKEISDSARYRMLGNAVCVNVAEWIGKRIITAPQT